LFLWLWKEIQKLLHAKASIESGHDPRVEQLSQLFLFQDPVGLPIRKQGSHLIKTYWQSLRDAVLSPQVSSTKIESQLRQSQADLPVPVFWLLGKAQSGKTSIVRAITGCNHAEIGNGFQPCTRTSRLYAFPDEAGCLLRFLDTRGLGEAGYDPTEDLNYCKEHAHLVMVVIKAMDHAQKPVLEVLETVRKTRPSWPVIVVQTSLHEGYDATHASHARPYPFDSEPWPANLPNGLVRSMKGQRSEFAKYSDRFVAVDLTLPEDGLEPATYGLESLWAAIEEKFPHGLRSMLESQPGLRAEFEDIYYQTAWKHVISYSAAAGGAGAVPWPLVDIPVVIGIQAKMFHAISSIYGQPLTNQLMTELGTAVGGGMLVRVLRSFLSKLVPVFGSVLGAAYNAATTYALGCTLCWYFAQVKRGATPDANRLREFYAKELEEGRTRFADYLRLGNRSPSSNPSHNK
jgi:uncharacterized protein (DUF697 family)